MDAVWYKPAHLCIVTVQLASGGTHETLGAAVIAMISSMFSRNQTDLLWMLQEEKQLTPPSSSPVFKVMLCAHGVSNSDRFSWTKPNMDRKRTADASIPRACCISTGRAVARGSASFKCVRGARSFPPLRLWSKTSPTIPPQTPLSLSLPYDWSDVKRRERMRSGWRSVSVLARCVLESRAACEWVSEWVFEASRAPQPRPGEEKKTGRNDKRA